MKILEYLSLIPKGIKNYDKIVEGIRFDKAFRRGEIPQDEAEEIIRRRIICSECPFMSENAKKRGLYKSDRDDEHCTLCECNIHYKTACMSCNCGIEVYNENNKNNPMDLKWEKYEKTEN